jgi:DNA-directed RNA polymerase specialized sigma24 family protein
MSPAHSSDEVSADLPFEHLVAALRAGNTAAWTQVFDRLLPRATEAIRCQFGAEISRAENAGGEAVASACRTIYRNITAGKFELHHWHDLAGLFIRIATNKCIDKLQRDGRLQNWAGRAGSSAYESGTFEPPAAGLTPPQEAVRAEALQEFRRVADLVRRRLERVDPKYCDIFRLRLEGKLTNEQIARCVGCSRATVQRAWAYAADLLKNMLDESLVMNML